MEHTANPGNSSASKRKLRLCIPADPTRDSVADDTDSLFTPEAITSSSVQPDTSFLVEELPGQSATSSIYRRQSIKASRIAPPIPGLLFDPSVLLSEDLADTVLQSCMQLYFSNPQINQIMLFGRAASSPGSSTSSFPPILNTLLQALSVLLLPQLPPLIYDLLFPSTPTRARQAILNLYHPGEGIKSHVDLLGRFGDGILGVSLGSGCVMRFDRVQSSDTAECVDAARHDLYLPDKSIIVLSGDARYRWMHGIEQNFEDFVEAQNCPNAGQWIRRGTRMSITFRWLLPGAEIVGG